MVGAIVLRNPDPDKEGRVDADGDDDESGNNPGILAFPVPYRAEGMDSNCLFKSGVR